ncbi:MAG: uroporphyrinogen decarboxylase family protein [Candidatus Hodarchaeales archaeon]|jgi:hypothetical protein
MNSHERVMTTLNRSEPDKVPIDLGDNVTGIHISAYRNLLEYLGIEDKNIRFSNFVGQTVVPCEELLQHFEIDTRYLQPPLHTIPERYNPIVVEKYQGNPVQISAKDMEPYSLKQRFGSEITFWGGVCDTQKTLPFGTPEMIRKEVKHNMRCFKPGGGFIAANIHNITAEVPPENIVAMFDAIRENRIYNQKN